MLDLVRDYDDLAQGQVGILRRTLTEVTDAELDWRPHPEANPIRWILGHHLWYEAWVADALDGTGRYLTDRTPASWTVTDADDFWARFEPLATKRRERYAGIETPDLDREIDYLNVGTYTLGRLVRTHAAHFTGHTWQVKYVRGTFSRAFGTDKRVFDPVG